MAITNYDIEVMLAYMNDAKRIAEAFYDAKADYQPKAAVKEKVQLKKGGFKPIDMALLPNGQLLFADPGHSQRIDKGQTAQQMQEKFNVYKEATKDYPRINHLFDYVDENGTCVQDKFFPRPKV